MTKRAHDKLEEAGLKTVRDVIEKNPVDFKTIANFGKKSQVEIATVLKAIGLEIQ